MIATPLRLIRSKPTIGLLLFIFLRISAVATPLDDVQTAATTWANLRAEMTRLESDWTSEKKILSASISSLNQNADLLAAEQETLMASTAKDRREIAELKAGNESIAEGLSMADTRMAGIAQKLIALRAAFPPRLSSALDLPFRSLALPDLPPGERAQHVMTILNRCNQFNQAFVLAEEIIPVSPGAEPQLLEIIYLGLAQACAIDRAAHTAYIGRPVNGQWTWESHPALAGDISSMIAIYQDRTEPLFVTVPAQLKGGRP